MATAGDLGRPAADNKILALNRGSGQRPLRPLAATYRVVATIADSFAHPRKCSPNKVIVAW